MMGYALTRGAELSKIVLICCPRMLSIGNE
jgi:hypothetical protein